MRIVCISDTHSQHTRIRVPAGDVLIHAGDATNTGSEQEVRAFLAWFAKLPHAHKILIAGNHDWLFQKNPGKAAELLAAHSGITYLQDSGVEIEGIRFWGSPWTPVFMDWAFNLPRRGERLKQVWGQVPEGTDVLISHGPPHQILDTVPKSTFLGCEVLRSRISELRPKLCVFGHIHHSWGAVQAPSTLLINASICDEKYHPIHQPIVVDLIDGTAQLCERTDGLNIEAIRRMREGVSSEEQAHLDASRPEALLKEMAALRGMDVEALIQEYLRRGIASDLSNLERKAAKAQQKTIPVTAISIL